MLRDLLQYDRPQSMYDSEIHSYIATCTSSGDQFANDPDKLFSDFTSKFHQWLINSKRNIILGLDAFPTRDIITGVTQFIDDIYQTNHSVFVLENEYKYHERLYRGHNTLKSYKELKSGNHLILSLPFPCYADIHPDTKEILDYCEEKGVKVHIDACWWGCSKDLTFNFDHPAIVSIGFSLSKGLGLGANRIGVRYLRKKEEYPGPVSIANEFAMVNQIPVWLGTKFIDKFGSDFWWNKYEDTYNKMCEELNLTPSKAIHIAYDGDRICGVRPILRKIHSRDGY